MATFNPKYTPQGDNNARNPYFKKINHVKLSKRDETRRRFADEVEPVEPELPVTGKLWIGDYDDTSVTVTASMVQGADTVRLVAVPVNSGATIMSPPLAVEPTYRYARATLAGLKPGSEYTIRLRSMGGVNSSEPGWVKTRPATRQAFAFGFASCGRAERDEAIYDTIVDQNADFVAFYHTGDRGYADIATNNVALFHAACDAVLSGVRQARLHRRPLIYIWDDHDYGPDNSGASSPSKAAALAWFRAKTPTRPRLTGALDTVSYSHSPMPGVEVVMLDTRSARQSGQLISPADEAWLISRIEATGQTADGVLLFDAGVPWIANAGISDTWGAAAAQRTRIADAITQYAPGRVAVIAGDAHMLAFDSGVNSAGGIPVFHAAPLAQSVSTKGGPYSGGTGTTSQNQYGRIEMAPVAGGWTITYRGYSVDAAGVQTQRLTHTAALVAPVPVAPAFDGASTITGATTEGATITVDPGPVSGRPAPNVAYQWRMDGTNVDGATGASFVRPAGTGGVPSVVITLDNDVEPNATRTVTAAATTAAEPAPAKTLGAIRQFEMFKWAALGNGPQVSAASGSFASAPQPGNLLVALVAADKQSGTFTVPSGWTMIDKHEGTTRSEVSGIVLYRIADGTETGPVTVTWGNLRRAAMNLVEVDGNFGPAPVIAQGAVKTEAAANSVALSTGTAIPTAPAFALAWMTNDTALRSSEGNITATNGFAIRSGTPSPHSSDGQPIMLVATKVVTAPEVVSTTISHGGSLDGTIGFLAVFGGA